VYPQKLEAVVAYCKIDDDKLSDVTIIASNIMKHYKINDIAFFNFCKVMTGSTYVKWT